MSFEELIGIRIYTCEARSRLLELYETGIISASDYVSSAETFNQTHQTVSQYMETHSC